VAAPAILAGKTIIIVLGVDLRSGSQLLELVEARRLARLLPRLRKYREENGSENRNDCDYYEQLYQRKSTMHRVGSASVLVQQTGVGVRPVRFFGIGVHPHSTL